MKKQAGLKTGLEAGAGRDVVQKIRAVTSERMQDGTENRDG